MLPIKQAPPLFAPLPPHHPTAVTPLAANPVASLLSHPVLPFLFLFFPPSLPVADGQWGAPACTSACKQLLLLLPHFPLVSFPFFFFEAGRAYQLASQSLGGRRPIERRRRRCCQDPRGAEASRLWCNWESKVKNKNERLQIL